MTHPGTDSAEPDGCDVHSGADVDGSHSTAESDADRRRAEARRRRHIDDVFGVVLPTVPEAEREPGQYGGFSAEHYRASRPPHWGDKQ